MSTTLRIREPDHDDRSPGKDITISDPTFYPLGYAELHDAILHQPITISLAGCGTVIGSSDQNLVGTSGEFSFSLESRFTSKCIGLVSGGWLPPTIALKDNSIVLPDRCVLAQLYARLRDGRTKAQAQGDFIDLFGNTTVRINPLLCVLEGDTKQNPNPEEVEQLLSEAVSKIRSALPKAELVAANSYGLKGVLGLINDTLRSMARNQNFLTKINPILKSPISSKNMQARWDEVLLAANECGVPRKSLVVIAALSTVAVPKGKSPARRLLKFREGYTAADAYNAAADLRSLEVLMRVFAQFPQWRAMLCTADRDLALFWVGLHASNFAFRDGRCHFQLTPADLLPGIPPAQWTD